MILMTMGKDYAFYFFPVIENVGKVRNYIINAEHILFWKHETRINDKYVIVVFKDCHVEADLLNTTKGNHRQDIFH